MVWFYLRHGWVGNCWSERLSIPLWSDFIYRKDERKRIWRKDFQSHYGLILSTWAVVATLSRIWTFNPTMVWFYLNALPSTDSPLTFTFNPTMVWFYLKMRHPGWLSWVSELSIPLWSDFIIDNEGTRVSKEVPFNPTMVWFYLKSTM